jgi:MFS family permease
MDTVGAFLGPLLAILLMAVSHDNFRLVFWIAVLPAMAAIAVIVYGVAEPAVSRSAERRRFPIRRAELARLSAGFWWLVIVAGILTLARFSEAFLLLAGQHAGIAVALVPTVLVAMNIVYAGCAYPLGRLADRMSRSALLVLGIGLLIAADLVLATAGSWWQVIAGAALWGAHMGATQGLLAVLVADAVPANLRGTAFGLYSLVTGAAVLAASVIAGWLWSEFGPAATFLAGAVFAAAALIGITLRGAKAAPSGSRL